MTILTLLLMFDEVTSSLDSAMDYGDYNLANTIENYLDGLAEEILCFERQM